MKSNAWQITAVVAIILVVVLIVPVVIMGRGWQEMNDRMKKAETDQRDSAAQSAKLEGDVKLLKGIIGKEDTPADEIKKQHSEDMVRLLPGENAGTQSYRSAVQLLDADLKKTRDDLKNANESLAQSKSDLDNARVMYNSANNQTKTKLEADNSRMKGQRDSLAETAKSTGEKMQKQEFIHKSKLAKAEEQVKDAEREKENLEQQVKDYSITNELLAEEVDSFRNPNVEYPAGKVLSVNQSSGLAVINLGSADGLLVRTMFSVYDSQVTGLSFSTAITGKKNPTYCDVCKRELSLSTNKASIEVMRVLGPHRAETRILDDMLTDPIAVGDVVYSPIWKPGQVLRFALLADMVLPGVDKNSGYEMLKHIIEANGGEVDCWIDESDSNIKSDDRVKGSISALTNYVVVNENMEKDLAPEIAKAQDIVLDNAKRFAVRKISLQDLLTRMGWKNVTPEYDFGKLIFTKEMRVVPGEPKNSPGQISELFRPDNRQSRLSNQDIEQRPSEGKTTDLFNSKKPAVTPSDGKTSELFKPRKPAAVND